MGTGLRRHVVKALSFTVAANSGVTRTAISIMRVLLYARIPSTFKTRRRPGLSVSGTAIASHLELQLNEVSSGPAGSVDATGMSALIYRINTGSPDYYLYDHVDCHLGQHDYARLPSVLRTRTGSTGRLTARV